jgi:CDP-2,3-bis-(O-geranylgeranyl)-sn-glycerol synthase
MCIVRYYPVKKSVLYYTGPGGAAVQCTGMATDIFFAIWLFLPAAVANVTPLFAAHIPGLRTLDAPIDGRRMYRGKRLLGDHKTWRGLCSGMVLATVALWIQQLAISHSAWLHTMTMQVDYQALPLLLLGPLLGLGALGGDAIESFFKRQRGVRPGRQWFPFDQLDYIIGGVIAALPFAVLSVWQYMWLAIIWLGAHLIASYIGYLIGWKEEPV